MAPLPCPFGSPWPLTVAIILLAGKRGVKCAFCSACHDASLLAHCWWQGARCWNSGTVAGVHAPIAH